MSHTRKLPPFAAIRAFEAAARHLSFKDGAQEIGVTPSAISHQIRSLEEHLGAPLFRRETAGIALTETGASYLTELTGLLDGLEAATRRVSRAADDRPLTVLCTPGFAARWLMPRLARCPGKKRVAIEVSTGAPSTDFSRNGADLVIAWTVPEVPGAVVEPFMISSRYPVCSPALKAAAGLGHPRDLLRQTLIRDEVMDGWEQWFRLAGVAMAQDPGGPRLPHCELTLSAAEQGQGVAMAYDAMARDALEAGRLVRLFDVAIPPITMYSIAFPEVRIRDPRIRAFRDWILAETEAAGNLIAPLRLRAV